MLPVSGGGPSQYRAPSPGGAVPGTRTCGGVLLAARAPVGQPRAQSLTNRSRNGAVRTGDGQREAAPVDVGRPGRRAQPRCRRPHRRTTRWRVARRGVNGVYAPTCGTADRGRGGAPTVGVMPSPAQGASSNGVIGSADRRRTREGSDGVTTRFSRPRTLGAAGGGAGRLSGLRAGSRWHPRRRDRGRPQMTRQQSTPGRR